MKVLAVHGIGWDKKKLHKEKAVDLWRIKRPIDELKKHVDWQIDEQPTFIQGIEKYKDKDEFTSEELEKAAKHLGQYDIIWSTYFTNPSFYALLRAVNARYGTKFVLDIDDDMFGIKEDNPIWLKLSHENIFHMQCMIRDADYITTTTERLAHVIRERREQPPETVFVIPNYINDEYQHGPFDNNGQIMIGYFGGSSHYNDLHESGALDAVQKIMHEHKNVRFTTVGMVVDKYIPKARYTYNPGMQGRGWIDKIFPSLDFDISIAPIDGSRFSECKSNIKWQESTRMGAAFVASNIGPYADLHTGVNALLVKNTAEDWYKALNKLVESHKLRKTLVEQAQKDLKFWRMEVNYPQLIEVFKAVHNFKQGKPSILLTN